MGSEAGVGIAEPAGKNTMSRMNPHSSLDVTTTRPRGSGTSGGRSSVVTLGASTVAAGASGGIAGGVAGFAGAPEHAAIVTTISVRAPTPPFYAEGMRWLPAAVVVVALCAVAHAQPVAPPTTVVYVVDHAMPVEKLEVVTRSLAKAVDLLDAADRIAVVGAGASASLDVALQLATPAAKKTIAARLSRIAWTERSNLKTALAKAGTVIAADKSANVHVVLLTDGADSTDLEPALRPLRTRRGVSVSRIGYQSAVGQGYDVVAAKPDELTDALVGQSGSGTIDLPYAVVLVLDRSGSMSGAKLEAAKESARVVAELLAPNDTIAVVAFDSESQVYIRPQRASNRMRISAEISRLQAGGGTNIYPGLKDAFEILQASGQARKMVILLTDGEAPSDGIAELVDDMRAARITVSAVGLQGADRNLLSMIADHGRGRLYMVEDIGALPKIFMKETQPPKRP